MLPDATLRLAAAGIVLLAMLIAPAPLLPPHRLAEVVQSMVRVDWQTSYLLATVALQISFYGGLGALTVLAVNRVAMLWWRLLQLVVVPIVVVGVAVLTRSIKLGHLPMLANALIPVAACLFGVGVGFCILYLGWKATLPVAVTAIAAALWSLIGDAPARLTYATEERLRQLVSASAGLPNGDERFGAIVEAAFATLASGDAPENSVQQNRAAILAMGIAVGHERLARWVVTDRDSQLVRQSMALRLGATLRGREDWSRHFSLSAALAVLESPLVSDAAGVMKEQLDAAARGSGFSFSDLAADRAGVRFAAAATHSEAAAKAMQARLRNGFVVDDFFPPAADLPENLTLEQFRRDYRSAGSSRYRQLVGQIETRLDHCAALTPRE